MRTSWAIWHCINEESKEKLKALLPAGYEPPTEHSNIQNIEGIEELTKIMKQKPRYPKRVIYG